MILIGYIAQVIGCETQTEQGFSFTYKIAANTGVYQPVIRRGGLCIETGKRTILFKCIIAFEVNVQVAYSFPFGQQAYSQIGEQSCCRNERNVLSTIYFCCELSAGIRKCIFEV